MEESSAGDHQSCHHVLDGCPYPLVVRCCSVWSAAARLPQQPCSRARAWVAVDPAGHEHRAGRQ
ncbi:MAG TPA: hypothetical protein DEF43_01170 [Chloroflexus aurantiacus]|nr:hypothetical protein [Chloroflexus aurantiacus]